MFLAIFNNSKWYWICCFYLFCTLTNTSFNAMLLPYCTMCVFFPRESVLKSFLTAQNLRKLNRIRWRLFPNEFSSLSASSERTKLFLQKSWASALRCCISCINNWEGSKKRGCSCFQGFQATVKRLWWRESVKACVLTWREPFQIYTDRESASLWSLQKILGIVSYLCVASHTSTAIRASGEPWKWHGWTGVEMVIRYST